MLAIEVFVLIRFGSADTFKESVALLALALIGVAFLLPAQRWLRYGAGAVVAVVAVALPMASPAGPNALLPRPVFTLAEGRDPGDPVSEFCLKNTPEDAVFLTPPQFGRFRLVARRAIVVDFKYAMPHDWAIIEWRQRLADCYGDVKQRGFAAAGEMEWHYASMPEGRMLWLRQKYGATYAVLFASTPCEFPLLYTDDRYKLVLIPEVEMD
jgi:hypothetical protein